MNLKEIKELLSLISELDLKEVNIKDKEFSIKVRTDKDHTHVISGGVQMSPQMTHAPAIAPEPIAAAATTSGNTGAVEAQEDISNYIEIKSPMVGTFYRSPSPDKDPYVQVGDSLKEGSVVCVIEAMKLFNEIESEITGRIVKVMAEDSSPVEYDQVLFLVDPNA